MSLHADLLDQAEMLAKADATRPKQASLRRAVSTAYYSVFHLVTTYGAGSLVTVPRFRQAAVRAFEHRALFDTAKQILTINGNPKQSHWLRTHVSVPISLELEQFCSTFVDLQQLRHQADYDMTRSFTKNEVLAEIHRAKQAHLAWDKEWGSDNALAFVLASLKLLRAS